MRISAIVDGKKLEKTSIQIGGSARTVEHRFSSARKSAGFCRVVGVSDEFDRTTLREDVPMDGLRLFAAWHAQASENVEKGRVQSEEALLLAMQEEMGGLTQAFLEAEHEDGEPERIDGELDNLGALLFQFHMTRQERKNDSNMGGLFG